MIKKIKNQSTADKGDTEIECNPDQLKKSKFKKRRKNKSSGGRHGYKFESEIIKSLEKLQLKHPDLYYKKWTDTHSYEWIKSMVKELRDILVDLKKIPGVKKVMSERILRLDEIIGTVIKLTLPKVPCDILVFWQGNAWMIECKSTKRKAGFNPFPPYIKEHQLDSGREIERAGVPYYFFVCDRVTPRHHKVYVIKLHKMRALMRDMDKENRRSMAWSQMSDYAELVLEKQKYQVYDLKWMTGD